MNERLFKAIYWCYFSKVVFSLGLIVVKFITNNLIGSNGKKYFKTLDLYTNDYNIGIMCKILKCKFVYY